MLGQKKKKKKGKKGGLVSHPRGYSSRMEEAKKQINVGMVKTEKQLQFGIKQHKNQMPRTLAIKRKREE